MTRKIKDENLRKRTTRRKSGKNGRQDSRRNKRTSFLQRSIQNEERSSDDNNNLNRNKKAAAADVDAITFPGRENRNYSSQEKEAEEMGANHMIFQNCPPRHTLRARRLAKQPMMSPNSFFGPKTSNLCYYFLPSTDDMKS